MGRRDAGRGGGGCVAPLGGYALGAAGNAGTMDTYTEGALAVPLSLSGGYAGKAALNRYLETTKWWLEVSRPGALLRPGSPARTSRKPALRGSGRATTSGCRRATPHCSCSLTTGGATSCPHRCRALRCSSPRRHRRSQSRCCDISAHDSTAAGSSSSMATGSDGTAGSWPDAHQSLSLQTVSGAEGRAAAASAAASVKAGAPSRPPPMAALVQPYLIVWFA